MKIAIAAAAVIALGALTLSADERVRVTGDYVEARTAEVFAGGCIMNSEAETAGRQAVMAWRVARGSVDGVTLDGLVVAAAVAADRNLGMREMGGEAPHQVRSILTVDDRATVPQRDALVRMARALSGGLLTDIVRVDVAPVRFAVSPTHIDVAAADALRLTVTKEMVHDPSCGAMQWFTPFSSQLVSSAMGTADAHAYAGAGLGSKWSAPHKRSAFWGTFAY